MVSNLVVRNKRTGYVTFVAKARVEGVSRTVEYICGLGTMTHEEFKTFQKWAHSMKDQEMRRQRVLACPFVVEEKVKIAGKVAKAAQKKTTVKRAPKQVIDKPDDLVKIEAKAKEREAFRKQYEEKKRKEAKEAGKKVKKVVTVDGIRFTGRKTLGEKRRILDDRITQLTYHIQNAKSAIRRWEKGTFSVLGWKKGTASGWKISDAKEKIARYEDARKTLRKQRAELHR